MLACFVNEAWCVLLLTHQQVMHHGLLLQNMLTAPRNGAMKRMSVLSHLQQQSRRQKDKGKSDKAKGNTQAPHKSSSQDDVIWTVTAHSSDLPVRSLSCRQPVQVVLSSYELYRTYVCCLFRDLLLSKLSMIQS